MRSKVILAIIVAVAFSGCMQASVTDPKSEDELPRFTVEAHEVRERASLPFATNGSYSYTLVPGPFEILAPLDVLVDVPVPVGNGVPVQQVHMGVFLPDVPKGTKVPVIADVGPYYGEDPEPVATKPAHRLGGFLIDNFVPHGFAVAQVSVLGTGNSGGCMDLMGEVEQAGVQAAVNWLGIQSWSNGNVGLIGRSYDGSTPWEAAMPADNPHLKTVVPISGLYGQHDLMWRNGSAELRGPGALWAIYFTFAYTGNHGNDQLQARQAAENTICPDTLVGPAEAAAAYATGDYVAPQANTYWTERSFREEVLENYKGSVYFIHGLQDWNVDNHMAFPFYQELKGKGLDIKGLFGQWGHNYPDRPSEHDNVRWDWAEDLLQWFNFYLKGEGLRPELHAEVQDAQGLWHIEETYPPQDATYQLFPLGEALLQQTEGEAIVSPVHSVSFRSPPLGADLRIAGNALFHVTVTPTGPGGQIGALLRDATDDRRIGHAIMDLRFADGGNEMQPVVPGMPLVAKMEFFAMDDLVPAGHVLELVLGRTVMDYLPSLISSPVVIDAGASSVLKIPSVVRGDDAFFMPPQALEECPQPEGGDAPVTACAAAPRQP